MDRLLLALRAAAEETRLRLLALCADGELTVSELTRVLGQSQPRVSRHLKLLCDAGLLERFREGSWVFYRLADGSEDEGGEPLAHRLFDLLPTDDAQLDLDRDRLADIKRDRAAAAAAYFQDNAEQWDSIRSLHVDESEVEQALLELLPGPLGDFLDIGTGTGRMLEMFAPEFKRGTGIDLSHHMLAVARANLEAVGLRNCQVRQADMYGLPMEDGSFDGAVIHQVLHYADRPGGAIAEAARVLRPGGTLVIVDFSPHGLENLRDKNAHRRLGFADDEVKDWLSAAGLAQDSVKKLSGDPLTVTLWSAAKPGVPQGSGRPSRRQPVEVA